MTAPEIRALAEDLREAVAGQASALRMDDIEEFLYVGEDGCAVEYALHAVAIGEATVDAGLLARARSTAEAYPRTREGRSWMELLEQIEAAGEAL